MRRSSRGEPFRASGGDDRDASEPAGEAAGVAPAQSELSGGGGNPAAVPTALANVVDPAFLDASPAAITITEPVLDAPGPRIWRVNPAFEAITGWPRERIEGQTPRVLQGPETDRAVFDDMKRTLRAGRPWRGETTNYRADGRPFVMSWSISPVHDASGTLVAYMAIQADVTAERERQRERDRLERQMTRFVDLSPEPILLVDANLLVLRISEGVTRITGWRPDDLVGEHIDALVPPRYRSVHRRHIAGFVAASERSGRMHDAGEIACRRRDGTEFPAHGSVVKMDDVGAGGFAVFLHDLSDVKAQQADLEANERRLRQAQRVANLGHWYWDAARGSFGWSDEVVELLGSRTPFLDAGVDVLLDRVDAGDRERARAFFNAALRGDEPAPVDLTIVRPDGTRRTLRALAEPKHDPSGALDTVFGVLQDVTEQRAEELALANANMTLDAANTAKTRFLAVLGHELRTPLNAINGFADLVAREVHGPIGESYRDYAKHIRDSGRHLSDLVESVLDVTRVEGGQITPRMEPVEAQELLRSVVDRIRHETTRSDVTVALLPTPSIDLRVDVHLFRQAVRNLVANAVKFAAPGGRVEISAGRGEHGGFWLTISDDGPGIPAASQERVTLPFVQGEDDLDRTYQGIGIGLYLARSFVELHGGDLELASGEKGGTTATVRLPADCVDAERDPSNVDNVG